MATNEFPILVKRDVHFVNGVFGLKCVYFMYCLCIVA